MVEKIFENKITEEKKLKPKTEGKKKIEVRDEDVQSDSPFINFYSEPAEIEVKQPEETKEKGKEEDIKSDSPYTEKFL